MSGSHKDDSPLTDELIEFAALHSRYLPSDYAIDQWLLYAERTLPDLKDKADALREIFRLAKIGNRRLRQLRKASDLVFARRLRKLADSLERDGGGE